MFPLQLKTGPSLLFCMITSNISKQNTLTVLNRGGFAISNKISLFSLSFQAEKYTLVLFMFCACFNLLGSETRLALIPLYDHGCFTLIL